VRTCRSCGRQNADDRDFCVCGEYLRWEPTSMLPATPAPAATTDAWPTDAAPTDAAPTDVAPPRPDAPATPAPGGPAGDAPRGRAAPEPVALTLRVPGDQASAPLDDVRLAVEPGGRAVLLALVRNQDAIVDNYDISVVGLPPDWYAVLPPTVYLVPFGAGGTYEQEVEIHVHPPRSAQAEARTWTFDVCVWSRAHQLQAAAAPASVDVAPYLELRTDLTPDRVRRRRQAPFSLGVENRANAAAQVELSAADADGECSFHFAQTDVTVAPGERVEVPFVVRPPRQIWIGRARDRPFEATAQARGGDDPLPPQPGVFRQRSWLPAWLLAVVPLLAAAAAAVLLLVPKKVTVPNLTQASSRFAVEQALVKARLNPVPKVEKVNAGGAPGTIVAQTPAAGSKVRVGTPVTIEMVVGSSQVTVPSVVGKKVQEAAGALDRVGLKLGEMLPAPPDPAATIQSQIPPAGKKANRGDAVLLFVVHAAQGAGTTATTPGATTSGPSLGPPVAVPAIAAGQSVQAAAASLAQAGVLPTTVQRIGSAPPGTLTGTVPAAGASVPRGSTVQLVVSAGFPELLFDTADGLMQVTAAGAAPAPVPGTGRGDDEATWSADGTHIAYRSGDALMLATPGQPGTPLLQPDAGQAFHDPAFAPQGHVLAFVRRTATASSLCLVDVQASVGAPACVDDPDMVLGRSITWSQDGTRILVAGQAKGRPNTFGLVLYTSAKPFSTTAADWGKGTVVTDARRPDVGALAAAFSPDGKRLAAAANFGGTFQLYLTTADDVALRHAKLVPVPACQLTWQPDGQGLAVVQTPNCAADAHGSLVLVDPAHPEKPVQVAPLGAHPAWQPLPPSA
jgi:beta-lactam-binding protein with PASTA domain/Tol biopolymer transport system component